MAKEPKKDAPGPRPGPESPIPSNLPEGPNGPQPPAPAPGKKRVLPKFDDLGPNVPSFEDYFLSRVEEIKRVQVMMGRALSNDPVVLDRQARECEAEYVKMRSIWSFADAYLDMAEYDAIAKMPERSSNFTDLDRQKALQAAVVRQRRFRDVVQGIVEGMDKRISYAQSHLRAFASAEGGRFQ